jgi:hypothetical protein
MEVIIRIVGVVAQIVGVAAKILWRLYGRFIKNPTISMSLLFRVQRLYFLVASFGIGVPKVTRLKVEGSGWVEVEEGPCFGRFSRGVAGGRM